MILSSQSAPASTFTSTVLVPQAHATTVAQSASEPVVSFFSNVTRVIVRARSSPAAETARLLAQIDALAGLGDGWDGRSAPAPSSQATALARRVVQCAATLSAMASRVVPDVEGGLAVYWMRGRREDGSHRLLASVCIDNDGAMAASTKDRDAGAFEAWDFEDSELRGVVLTLERFVSSGSA